MSKWKDISVDILQIIHSGQYSLIFGLGDDYKIYRWDDEKGGWQKHWTEVDKPE